MGGRVDDVDGTVGAPHEVAGPEISVNARRWFGRPGVLRDAAQQALDRLDVVVGDRSAVVRELEVRKHPTRREELRPCRCRLVRQRREPDVAVSACAELIGTRGVRTAQPLPEVVRRLGRGTARLDPGDQQAIVGDTEHVRYVGSARLGEPAQAGRFALEESRWGLRPGLRNGASAVGQTQAGTRADVTACDGSRGNDADAEQLLGPRSDASHPCHASTLPGPQASGDFWRNPAPVAVRVAPRPRPRSPSPCARP